MRVRFIGASAAVATVLACLMSCVHARDPVPLTCAGGVAAEFQLDGAVAHPVTIGLNDRRAAPSGRLEVTFVSGTAPVSDTYRGVLLADLLAQAVVDVDASRKNDILSKYVVVTGSDFYQVVIPVGDVLADFGGQPILVAYANSAGLLTIDGMARLVVPGDKKGGRYVSNIARIEVRGVRPQ
jgi:DMSO/TMAO reductase YedYZ molybdopterin-dependent catalytic subunit